MRIITAILVNIALLTAQVLPPPPPPAQDEPEGKETVFKTGTQLVVVNVIVKDKDGKFIESLKASDFTVTEDGKQQALKVFEYQKLDDDTLPPPPEPEPADPVAPVSTVKPAVALTF